MKHATSAQEKRTLQLVRLALDLVGRPPLETELAQLHQGVEIPELVDQYLDSQEFRDYYFNRIRLYLESQGTVSKDEPARLWSYVAFNDLPFSDILTADYTVDAQFKKQTRPSYHARTGVLTSKGFIEGKPGLPHYNYAAQVSMLFLGYVFELPPEVAESRESITALGTTDPDSACYSCHKILTPLALQRGYWTDDGKYRNQNKDGSPIRADDRGWVDEYPFKGVGMEAFATQAVKKERFIRTMMNTHFNFFFGRSMRHLSDESKVDRLASGAAQANEYPRFLVYWFLEGAWCGYDMFNPVMTENNVIHRLDRISDERYRVLRWGEESYGIKQHGNIRYGYLAEKGRDLFKDMAVVSSMMPIC